MIMFREIFNLRVERFSFLPDRALCSDTFLISFNFTHQYECINIYTYIILIRMYGYKEYMHLCEDLVNVEMSRKCSNYLNSFSFRIFKGEKWSLDKNMDISKLGRPWDLAVIVTKIIFSYEH